MLNPFISLLLIVSIAQTCNTDLMHITILDKIKLDDIPSGSGISKAESGYYVIGDDSPFLFALNEEFQVTSKTPLVQMLPSSDGRIPKSEKPDFETLERISENELVMFGSGSKSPQRDVFIRILLTDSMHIEKYEISSFYKTLKSLPVFSNSELNIEATAFHNGQLFLLNRKKNLVIQLVYTEFLNFLNGKSEFPQLDIREYSLPRINGVEAGFSGATTLKHQSKIMFTASVEDTENAYDDGEILGSFIGMIDIDGKNISESFDFCQIPDDDGTLKVESVCIGKEISNTKTEVILMTDDDKGNSVLLKSILTW